MGTTLTSKGQVTIPKHVRDALSLKPGMTVRFAVNATGELVVQPTPKRRTRDRFEAVRGTADIKWKTDDLMKLLRTDG